MWKGTILRIFLLFDIGIILYLSLLYLNGYKESARLKRRKNNSNKRVEVNLQRPLIIYLALILLLIISGMITMKYIIRGEL